jgi:hypothetical protein
MMPYQRQFDLFPTPGVRGKYGFKSLIHAQGFCFVVYSQL